MPTIVWLDFTVSEWITHGIVFCHINPETLAWIKQICDKFDIYKSKYFSGWGVWLIVGIKDLHEARIIVMPLKFITTITTLMYALSVSIVFFYLDIYLICNLNSQVFWSFAEFYKSKTNGDAYFWGVENISLGKLNFWELIMQSVLFIFGIHKMLDLSFASYMYLTFSVTLCQFFFCSFF